jgi:predicted ATPase
MYRLPARMPAGVGTSGEYAVGILASDVARRRGQLVRQINEGLADQISGWELDVVEWGAMFSVVIKSRHDTSLSVNLADAGTGIAQELPIFVQRAMDVLDPPEHPVLEIIEQPELHLHPAAHAALADLYLHATRDTRVRFIIETHSETLLLRLRRRIAEGDYDPADLAIYFVDHQSGAATVNRINVGEDGGLDYWPAGVFSEDYDEARAIASAQLARRDAGAR